MYVSSTEGAFKKRYYNDRSSLAHEIYRHMISLSNCVGN